MCRSSNRTLLELKYDWAQFISGKKGGSNRTLLELKSRYFDVALSAAFSSNRTLLELKCINKEAVELTRSVPIVPYWN